MSKLNYPDRIILLSDTFGGHPKWHPLHSPDIDAAVATSIRSGIGEALRFDTYGAENITDHILRSVINLHEKNPNTGKTGVFINGAPRVVEEENGYPFYVADIGDRVRVVATPLEALSVIRDQITSLWHLPNKNNGLYDGDREQFRSSFTPRLLADNHGLDLVNNDPSIIPPYPEGCKLAYVDRFGNFVFFDNAPKDGNSVSEKIDDNFGKEVEINISDIWQNAQVTSSLASGKPGSLIIYGNDGNIEVIKKWESEEESPEKQFAQSAYGQSEIDIGTSLNVRTKD